MPLIATRKIPLEKISIIEDCQIFIPENSHFAGLWNVVDVRYKMDGGNSQYIKMTLVDSDNQYRKFSFTEDSKSKIDVVVDFALCVETKVYQISVGEVFSFVPTTDVHCDSIFRATSNPSGHYFPAAFPCCDEKYDLGKLPPYLTVYRAKPGVIINECSSLLDD